MINKYEISSRNKTIERYQRRYSSSPWASQLYFLRRKYAWLIIVKGAKLMKRAIDISSSIILLVIFSPLLLAVAGLIKLTDFGPVFFNQIRIGKYGKEFTAYKFRSMITNADKMVESVVGMSHHKDSISYKIKKDPRVTWIGKIIRKTSIDELPQLFNVLVGDMSLVGPRPHVHREVDKYTLAERKRLNVTPGITCIWQVSGRADIAFPEQMQLDLKYIRSKSLWTDIKILLQTIPAVISAKGAY